MPLTASLRLLLVLLVFSVPADPQLGAPLGRCGPQSHDLNWPQNQLPGQSAAGEAEKKRPVDGTKLQRTACELAELSASIPTDVDRANRGLLSKDIIDKLKRVEKLSKELRSELTR